MFRVSPFLTASRRCGSGVGDSAPLQDATHSVEAGGARHKRQGAMRGFRHIRAVATAGIVAARVRDGAIRVPRNLRACMLACLLPLLLPCSGATAADALRTSFDLQVPTRPAVVPVDGARELRYELRLANFSAKPLVPMRVDVLDADGDRVLASFDGDALRQRLAIPGATGAPAMQAIAPGALGVAYIEFALPGGAAPKAIAHRIRYRADDGSHVVAGGHAAIDDRPPPVLGPPLRGGPWVAVHSPAWPRGHRRMAYAVAGRARIPGRYAIDWIKVDARGRTAHGDPDRVADAYGYRADVLAVADATVAATRDDMAESATLSAHPRNALADATGNYIALALGDGRFAFYEHLAPGSIRVERGDRVRRGEVIASLGFTGDSTGPHLHFHVADGPSPLGAEGVAFVIDRFRLLGRYPDIAALGSVPWAPPKDGAKQRTRQWPASGVVVDFGMR